MAIKKAQGFYETFDRSGSVTRDVALHYAHNPDFVKKNAV